MEVRYPETNSSGTKGSLIPCRQVGGLSHPADKTVAALSAALTMAQHPPSSMYLGSLSLDFLSQVLTDAHTSRKRGACNQLGHPKPIMDLPADVLFARLLCRQSLSEYLQTNWSCSCFSVIFPVESPVSRLSLLHFVSNQQQMCAHQYWRNSKHLDLKISTSGCLIQNYHPWLHPE